jgi:hypothetical protein
LEVSIAERWKPVLALLGAANAVGDEVEDDEHGYEPDACSEARDDETGGVREVEGVHDAANVPFVTLGALSDRQRLCNILRNNPAI